MVSLLLTVLIFPYSFNTTEMFLDDLNVTILSKDKFQFEQKKIFKLGSGGFGDVYKGIYDGNTVAVKCFAKESLPHASSIPSSLERKAKTEPVKVNTSKMNNKDSKSKRKSTLMRRLSSFGDWKKGSSSNQDPGIAHTVGPIVHESKDSSPNHVKKHSQSASASTSGNPHYFLEFCIGFKKKWNKLVKFGDSWESVLN